MQLCSYTLQSLIICVSCHVSLRVIGRRFSAPTTLILSITSIRQNQINLYIYYINDKMSFSDEVPSLNEFLQEGPVASSTPILLSSSLPSFNFDYEDSKESAMISSGVEISWCTDFQTKCNDNKVDVTVEDADEMLTCSKCQRKTTKTFKDGLAVFTCIFTKTCANLDPKPRPQMHCSSAASLYSHNN